MNTTEQSTNLSRSQFELLKTSFEKFGTTVTNQCLRYFFIERTMPSKGDKNLYNCALFLKPFLQLKENHLMNIVNNRYSVVSTNFDVGDVVMFCNDETKCMELEENMDYPIFEITKLNEDFTGEYGVNIVLMPYNGPIGKIKDKIVKLHNSNVLNIRNIS